MFGGLGLGELIVIGIVAVLLFGKRLPEVARSVGQSYHQFRRSLSEIQSEMSQAVDSTNSSLREATSNLLTYDEDDYDEPTAPAFTPPPRESSSQQ